MLAVDIDRWREFPPSFDYSPRLRETALEKYAPPVAEKARWDKAWKLADEMGFNHPNPFLIAKRLLTSKVELRYDSIYGLEDNVEPHDVVLSGTMNPHLKNLPSAMESLRRVTKEVCIIAAVELLDPPVLSGFQRILEKVVGRLILHGGLRDRFPFVEYDPVCLYTGNRMVRTFWKPSVTAFREMLEASGFSKVVVHSRLPVRNLKNDTPMPHVVFHCHP